MIHCPMPRTVLGVAAILATLIVISGLLSRGVTRPIEELGRATRAVAAGCGGVPDAPRTAAVEIQALYADFAAMADAIERRSRYLRDFAHAVSHEFKTPLAGIRGAIELLADHGATMSVEERARFLGNADADAGRLALLVTRLLDLARADMTVAAHDARSEVAPVLAAIADALGGEAFAVRVDAPAALLPVAVPAATLEAVLTGLVENSRQAGAASATITARVADRLLLTVADDGSGIAPTDRARVFEPFFTSRRGEGGSGLGLAIVRSLLDAAGATVKLAEAERGAVFVLSLPLA